MTNSIRSFLHGLQRFLPDSNGVHILAYHLLDGGTGLPVDISLEVFKSQMKELVESAKIRSLQQAIEKLELGNIMETIVAVTFDDAYQNFYEKAWPVIQEFQIPVTLYVPVNFVEGNGPQPIRHTGVLPPCTWTQLLEMAKTGLVTIGSHTCNHVNLRMADSETAEQEIIESRKRLEDKLGIPVTSFCYPKALWSRSLEKIVCRAYDSAVIGGGRKMQPERWNRYRLNRIPIRRNMPAQLAGMLSSSLWIEEAVAASFRPWIARWRSQTAY